MDEGNRLFKTGAQGGGRGNLPVMKENSPTIPFVNTGQDFDQRRFASPVFTEQGENLPRLHLDAHLIDHRGIAKALDDVFHLQQA